MNNKKSPSLKEAYKDSYEKMLDWSKKSKYFKETISLLRTLNKHGFDPVKVDDGEEIIATPTQTEAAVAINNVEEAFLFVKKRSTNKVLGLFIVLGNDPGELVADCHVDIELDKATKEHNNRWEK